jgi:hypothetical protein
MRNELDIFEAQNWLYFKLYRKHVESNSWKERLDWYHIVLREIVKPWAGSQTDSRFILFSLYGPEQYCGKERRYVKQLSPVPLEPHLYINVRSYVPENKQPARENLVSRIRQAKFIWDFEEVDGYDVRGDLGNRFGRLTDGTIDEHRTISFIRYWDAACKYILEVLTSTENWDETIDVWGVSHMVNDSLGAWLRLSDAECPQCHSKKLCINTNIMDVPLGFQSPSPPRVPLFLCLCPQCNIGCLRQNNI